MEFARTKAARMDIFGDANPPLDVLTEEPGKAVLMSQHTL